MGCAENMAWLCVSEAVSLISALRSISPTSASANLTKTQDEGAASNAHVAAVEQQQPGAWSACAQSLSAMSPLMAK
jgi:hypothetical protein